MAEIPNSHDQPATAAAKPPSPFLDIEHAPLPAKGLLRRQHWLTVLMPFLVYMFWMFGLESRLGKPGEKVPDAAALEKMGIEERDRRAKSPNRRARKQHPPSS